MVPTPLESPAPAPGRGKRIAGVITIGVGAVLVGGGYWFGRLASEKEAEVAEVFAEGGTWTPELQRAEDDGRAASLFSASLYGAGAACVVAGAIVYWLGRSDAESAVRPRLTRRGAALSWSF